MADQAERVILEAEDQVTPTTDKANTALDGFEKKAESSHGKVIRISDQTRSSVKRLIASLEKQAETYGKSGVDRLITQRDQLLQRYNREPQAIDAITRSGGKMIAMAAREAHRETCRSSPPGNGVGRFNEVRIGAVPRRRPVYEVLGRQAVRFPRLGRQERRPAVNHWVILTRECENSKGENAGCGRNPDGCARYPSHQFPKRRKAMPGGKSGARSAKSSVMERATIQRVPI